MGDQIRIHVIIHGRVQGVFFRAETRKAALQRNISGWVKNRSDGAVEAVFEGRQEDAESMVAWCRVGSPLSRVDSVETTIESYTGRFDSFDVTY